MKSLIANICRRLRKVFPASWLIMLISTPKPTAWIPLSKPWKTLKHLLSSMRFQHDLRGLHGVSFRDVHKEMYMVQGETKITELKPKSFQVMERLDTGVDIELLSKTVISVMGDKHHRHPVIAGVTRNLFRATAIYNIHVFFSCRAVKVAGDCLLHATKKESFIWRKKDTTFHLRVFHFVSDHAVFPVATIKKFLLTNIFI